MRRALLAVFAALLILSTVTAIPEPPPYFWEYTAPGTVAFIPFVTHSGPVLMPEQLQPGW